MGSKKSLEESVVASMDGSENELFPFLPYILQDLWEIGASPEVIIKLVQKHTNDYSNLSILDLGCGKGAVSIKLAKEFNCTCLGIDAIKEFINSADAKAREVGVDNLCRCEAGDIREKVNELTCFDVIILGAIGPVFGNYYFTLTTLSKCLNQNGIIIIDDSYIDNNSDFTHPQMLKKEVIIQQIEDAGMRFVDEVVINASEIKNSDDTIFESIKKRCHEMIEKNPAKRSLFLDYIKKQQEENDVLETKVVCSTMLIRKR